MPATNLKKTGRFQQPPKGPIQLKPAHLNHLQRCLDPAQSIPLPIRPEGGASSATDCHITTTGTTVQTTGLDRIVNIDAYNHTVTAEAGVPLNALVQALAQQGLELIGGYELQGRTVGGAISAPCFGPSIGNRGSYFSSHVAALKIVTADGRLLKVDSTQKNLLASFRMSFGLLGVIYEATLKVRPIRTFSASHRRVSIDKFADIVDTLSMSDVGFKFYLMPYRDRVYLDLRRYDADASSALRAPWKLKDWGESTVLPHVFKSVNRLVPIAKVKYGIIDSISEATQGLVNSRLVSAGSNAASQSRVGGKPGGRRRFYSTWCFPAANFSMVAKAYREFSARIWDQSQY
ncbi:MAG: FAD-binding oxidoreductase, partial [Gammaproteobacteria bacterium]|nr:FAD-binding oxidoreductase [Gammaproteobacteria bacterium]